MVENKKLAEKLYCLLDEEVCFSDICGETDFKDCFERAVGNDIELLAVHMFNHLCRYSPLGEWLKKNHINEDVYVKEIQYALNVWFKGEEDE